MADLGWKFGWGSRGRNSRREGHVAAFNLNRDPNSTFFLLPPCDVDDANVIALELAVVAIRHLKQRAAVLIDGPPLAPTSAQSTVRAPRTLSCHSRGIHVKTVFSYSLESPEARVRTPRAKDTQVKGPFTLIRGCGLAVVFSQTPKPPEARAGYPGEISEEGGTPPLWRPSRGRFLLSQNRRRHARAPSTKDAAGVGYPLPPHYEYRQARAPSVKDAAGVGGPPTLTSSVFSAGPLTARGQRGLPSVKDARGVEHPYPSRGMRQVPSTCIALFADVKPPEACARTLGEGCERGGAPLPLARGARRREVGRKAGYFVEGNSWLTPRRVRVDQRGLCVSLHAKEKRYTYEKGTPRHELDETPPSRRRAGLQSPQDRFSPRDAHPASPFLMILALVADEPGPLRREEDQHEVASHEKTYETLHLRRRVQRARGMRCGAGGMRDALDGGETISRATAKGENQAATSTKHRVPRTKARRRFRGQGLEFEKGSKDEGTGSPSISQIHPIFAPCLPSRA
ncbi:hypothetical protein EV715DRAFT_266975 [Schizophyllum commune]